MRTPQQNQLLLYCPPIGQIDLNTNCRPSHYTYPASLQHLHSKTQLLGEIVALIDLDAICLQTRKLVFLIKSWIRSSGHTKPT